MPLVLKPAVKSSLIETDKVKLLADTLKISRPLAEVLYTRAGFFASAGAGFF